MTTLTASASPIILLRAHRRKEGPAMFEFQRVATDTAALEAITTGASPAGEQRA